MQTVKGYTRKGGALFAMKRFTDAQKTYQKALELDPANKVTAYCQLLMFAPLCLGSNPPPYCYLDLLFVVSS